MREPSHLDKPGNPSKPAVAIKPPIAIKTPTSGADRKIQEIFAHFGQCFPEDPTTPLGKHFASAKCSRCWGRGLLTYLDPKDSKKGKLELCPCVRKALFKESEELSKTGKSFLGPRPPVKPKTELEKRLEAGFNMADAPGKIG